MNPEVRSAMTGHSARRDESAHYGSGMGSFVKVLAENIAMIPPAAAADDQKEAT
jgi:hypothetical protein